MSFSTTIAPPYDLNSINEFFKSPSLPAINVLVNFVDAYDTKFYEIYSNPDDNKIFSKQMASLRNNYINSRISGEEPSLVEKGIFESSIVRIHTRARENINGCFPPNGICVPGVRRRFVESDGSIYPCERTGNAFSVGSVQKGGVDQKRGFNLIDEYISNSEKYCSECWAQRLCGLCFATACRNGKYSQSRKNGYCITEKSSIHESLKTYVSVLENNSAGYDFVKDMKFD